LVAGSLPRMRNSDYLCPSLTAVEDVTVNFPAGVKLISIPDPEVLKTEGVSLTTDYDRTKPRALRINVTLKIDHPEASCTPEYYARVHDTLARMAKTLRREVIYRGPAENEK
jgi:hypothetical protein